MTIPTTITIQVNELVYSITTVILEMFGCMIKKNSNIYASPGKLDTKMKTIWREVSQLVEIDLQNGVWRLKIRLDYLKNIRV